jgi:bis(5'-nucleosyl)-tetraphosphatase (symmetrical)
MAYPGEPGSTHVQTIFIGDVQGCADELDELLERARADFGDGFTLWCVGDLVNRGPLSLRALERIRERHTRGLARVVLGNHELALLRSALGLRTPAEFDSFSDVLASPDLDAWVDWLRRRPLIETGRLGAQRFVMVHAAVHPEWSLETLCAKARAVESRLADSDLGRVRQFLVDGDGEPDVLDTLERLTCCRSVDSAGGWSSQQPDGRWQAWHRAWSEQRHPYGVVYGHWALQGLHVAPGLRGLDTGCVHHGRGRQGFLTAWLPDPEADTPFDVPDDHFWQVPARRMYYAHRDAAG